MFHIYTFPVDSLNGSTTIQLIMKMQFAPTGTDVNYTAATENVWVNKYGSLVWEYDLEDRFVTPGTMRIEIADPDEVLSPYFFSRSGTYDNVEIHNSQVELNLGGSLEFSGNIVADTAEFDEGKKLLRFTVACDSEAINNQVLILDDDTNVNPFGYTNNGGLILLATSDPTLGAILGDIYELVNSSITVQLHHGWRAKTVNSDPSYNVLPQALHWNPWEFTFWDEHVPKTAGDLLRQIAFDFCAYTGLVNRNWAFFKQLFRYESVYTFTPNVLDITRRITYPHYEFIRLTNDDGATLVQAERGDEEQAGASGKYVKSGTFLYNFNFGSPLASMWGTGITDLVTGWQWSEKSITQQYHINILGDCLWYFRQYHRHNHIVTTYKMNGVDGIDINRDFQYNSVNHNCLRMEKNFDEVTTKIDALELR